MASSRKKRAACVAYIGGAGVSKECQEAVMHLLQCRVRVVRARILSCSNRHCLLLADEIGDQTLVKSGFASGYGGTGPHAFSYTLQLLHSHGAEIDEIDVEEEIIERIDHPALTDRELESLDQAKPIRPSRWYDYILEEDIDFRRTGTAWAQFPPVVPFGIIDLRIMDLAISFWDNPDEKLLSGYRRLEEIVRSRTGLKELVGQKLFSQAFLESPPKLIWKELVSSEQRGRGQLFVGAYMAHRNTRAHSEPKKEHESDQLSEFLLLNHLYRLEKEATAAPSPASDPAAELPPPSGSDPR